MLDYLIPILMVLGILFGAFGAFGAWVSSQKNRDSSEGFLLGFLFGPLGVLIAALVPTLPKPVQSAPPAPPLKRTPSPEEIEAENRRLDPKREANRLRHEQYLAEERERVWLLPALSKEQIQRLVAERQERARRRLQMCAEMWAQCWRRFATLPEGARIAWAQCWRRFATLPEGARIAVGVAAGVVVIAAMLVFAVVFVRERPSVNPAQEIPRVRAPSVARTSPKIQVVHAAQKRPIVDVIPGGSRLQPGAEVEVIGPSEGGLKVLFKDAAEFGRFITNRSDTSLGLKPGVGVFVFAVPTLARVLINRTDRLQVIILEGQWKDRTGWIARGWVRPRATPQKEASDITGTSVAPPSITSGGSADQGTVSTGNTKPPDFSTFASTAKTDDRRNGTTRYRADAKQSDYVHERSFNNQNSAQPSDTPDGTTATGIPLHMGPRGGIYHYSASGRKVYERKRR
jgi:hypothetical protein